MNATDLRAGMRVEWRTWCGPTSAIITSWSEQGIHLQGGDGHEDYWPTDSTGLNGLLSDLTAVVE